MQNLLQDLENLLKTATYTDYKGEIATYTDYNGTVVKNIVVEIALQLHPDLLRTLLKNERLKEQFFTDVDGILVFDKVAFIRFVNLKEFMADSYTKFTKKIGLALDSPHNEFLYEKQNVVLNFPHKDCILQGGQTKDDSKNRNEVFWNTLLARDQIDSLFDRKILTNLKKFVAKPIYAPKTEELLPEEPKIIGYEAIQEKVTKFETTDNFIIKGNNLIALHCLKHRYEGKIKLIYIDPPYNTGNDSFRYNDQFNHSAWLVFMKNRLDIAKKLLAKDGSIAIQIDDNEQAYLKVLCDEVFGIENFVTCICIKRSAVTGHKAINPTPVNVTDYVLLYAKNKSKWIYKPQYAERGFDKAYSKFIDNFDDNFENWTFITLNEAFKKYNKTLQELLNEFPERIIRFAQPDYQGVGKETKELINKSKKNPSVIFRQVRESNADIYLKNGDRILFYKDKLKIIDGQLVTAELLSNFWEDIGFQGIAKEGGITLVAAKKPEKLLQRIIEFSTNKDDIILDFFAGSGTSLAVAHKTGRQYIGIEQMDYIEDLPERRLINVINGEQSGISKATNWSGGGSFIYCELQKYNELYAEKIQIAETAERLTEIRAEMLDKAFMNYLYREDDLVANETDFLALDLASQKQFLLALLDLNQLYVNIADSMDTVVFGDSVSKEDLRLSREFYQKI